MLILLEDMEIDLDEVVESYKYLRGTAAILEAATGKVPKELENLLNLLLDLFNFYFPDVTIYKKNTPTTRVEYIVATDYTVFAMSDDASHDGGVNQTIAETSKFDFGRLKDTARVVHVVDVPTSVRIAIRERLEE